MRTVGDPAERRRAALRNALAANSMTIREAADAAGLKGPSGLGNFLNERTDSLNLATLEPLATVLGVSLNHLVGDARWPLLSVMGSVNSGRWLKRAPFREKRNQGKIVVPKDEFSEISYILSLETSEMDEIWKPGTLLQVVDLVDFPGTLAVGNKVIVLHHAPRGVAVGCREICEYAADGGGRSYYLVTRSRDPRYKGIATMIDWPVNLDNRHALSDGSALEIKAVVVRSVSREI